MVLPNCLTLNIIFSLLNPGSGWTKGPSTLCWVFILTSSHFTKLYLHSFFMSVAPRSHSFGLLQHKNTEPEGWCSSSSYVECRAQSIAVPVLQCIKPLHSNFGNWIRPSKIFHSQNIWSVYETTKAMFCYPIGFAIVNFEWDLYTFFI